MEYKYCHIHQYLIHIKSISRIFTGKKNNFFVKYLIEDESICLMHQIKNRILLFYFCNEMFIAEKKKVYIEQTSNECDRKNFIIIHLATQYRFCDKNITENIIDC